MRELSDAKFQFVTHRIFQLSGKFWFVVSAYSDDVPGEETCLKGKVFIYKSKDDWRSKGEPTVRPNIYKLHSTALSSYPDRYDVAEQKYNASSETLTKTADMSVSFELFRNGEVYISQPSFRDEDLRKASMDYAAQWGHDFLEWVANQCYFFLRDLAHKHQHHPSTEDTVIILQLRTTDPVLWRKRIIFSLYYYIIGSKRNDGIGGQTRALGILAYCRSFEKLCKAALSPEDGRKLPEFSTEALSDSIDARIREETAREERRINRETHQRAVANGIRTTALAFAAIMVGFIAILVQSHISEQERFKFAKLYGLSVLVTENFFNIVLFLLAFLVLAWAVSSRIVLRYTLSIDTLEVGIRRRRRAALLFAAVGIAVIATSSYLWGWKTLIHMFDFIADMGNLLLSRPQ